MPNLPNGTKGGFEPGLTRLRVRHSTTKLPRSTLYTVEYNFGLSKRDRNGEVTLLAIQNKCEQ